MPGYLLHAGSTIICAHNGKAQPISPIPRVTVQGQPVVTQPVPHAVSACTFVVAGAPMPCVIAQWTKAATRVTVLGQPVLLADSMATCIPNGTPVNIIAGQSRVQGT